MLAVLRHRLTRGFRRFIYDHDAMKWTRNPPLDNGPCRLSRYLTLYSCLDGIRLFKRSRLRCRRRRNKSRYRLDYERISINFSTISTMTNAEQKTPKIKRFSTGVGGAMVELEQDPNRGGWANPIEFILSCIGYAVGIGNVWRFPYLVYRNGGGAFLIPFVLMLITMGLPIFFLELVVGQYSGLGPNEAFTRMAPALQGLGYCTLVVILLVMVYYMVIVAWILFYTFVSFMPKLSWAYCDNDFNTNDCYSGLQQKECQKENPETVFYNRSCIRATTVCESLGFSGGNVTHCFKDDQVELLRHLYKQVLSSEEYFNDYVLGMRGATWENFGGIRWELLGCLTLAWIICFLCLMRGVQSIGKVVYFTALFPYVMLTALLIQGCTLTGSDVGSLWFITPKWSTLESTAVWADAASQVFYSLGIGCGSLITLSSYSNFNNNCHRDAIFVTFTNLGTSIFAGFVIFSIMGFLAHEMGMPIDEVIKSGAGLAFIAYPEAVVLMPLPNVWAVLFFVMLFILGLGSQFAGVQAINTAILDLRPDLRKHESYVVLGICVTCWLLAIPMVFDGGIYLFTLMDWNTASWAILLIGIAEVGVVGWCYGCNKFLRNIAEMQMRFGLLLRGYWWLSWVVLAPITCLAVFVYQICTYEMPRYGKYIFPGWANAIGILIGLSTLAPMPFFFIRRLWKGPRDRSLFRPKKTWGPAVDKNTGNDTPSTASVKASQV